MKRIIYLFSVYVLLLSSFSLSACSSSDEKGGDSIKTVVGTYNGVITGVSDSLEDAVLIIEDAGSGKVKITTNKGTTPKIISNVKYTSIEGDNDFVATTSEVEGNLIYMVSDRYLIVATNKTNEEDITFSFEGTKQ